MAATSSPDTVPTGFLVGAALAMAVAIGGAAWSRIAGPVAEASAPVVLQRHLRFEDLPSGSIRVTDVDTGGEVETIEGEAGFARGALRSLARERRRRGVEPGLPFTLQAHQDGRVTLRDAATGERLDLVSFGPANAAVFARMLPSPGASR